MKSQTVLQPGMQIHDRNGAVADIVAIEDSGDDRYLIARLPDGQRVAFSTSMFASHQRPEYAGSFGDFQTANPMYGDATSSGTRIVLPVVREELNVDKQSVDSDRGVRIEKKIEQHEEVVDLPLMRDELVVEHVARDVLLPAGEMPSTREEGDTTIIPVLEEVLIVEKRVRLREEIRITRRRHETHDPQHVVLRSEQIDVRRFDR